MLKAHDGHLNFTTDAWTSPNHRAYVAICVHLEYKGSPLLTVLDIMEVAEVRKSLTWMGTVCWAQVPSSPTQAQISQPRL